MLLIVDAIDFHALKHFTSFSSYFYHCYWKLGSYVFHREQLGSLSHNLENLCPCELVACIWLWCEHKINIYRVKPLRFRAHLLWWLELITLRLGWKRLVYMGLDWKTMACEVLSSTLYVRTGLGWWDERDVLCLNMGPHIWNVTTGASLCGFQCCALGGVADGVITEGWMSLSDLRQ